jgi:cell division protease FtsH
MFDKISTDALNDLEKVTRQARAIVSIYGLNDKIGNITYYDSSGQADYSFTKPYSELTAQTIDEEISKIIEQQYQRAIDILEENKDKLIELAEILVEKEVIFEGDLKKIFGDRPFDKEVTEKVNETATAEKETEAKKSGDKKAKNKGEKPVAEDPEIAEESSK